MAWWIIKNVKGCACGIFKVFLQILLRNTGKTVNPLTKETVSEFLHKKYYAVGGRLSQCQSGHDTRWRIAGGTVGATRAQAIIVLNSMSFPKYRGIPTSQSERHKNIFFVNAMLFILELQHWLFKTNQLLELRAKGWKTGVRFSALAVISYFSIASRRLLEHMQWVDRGKMYQVVAQDRDQWRALVKVAMKFGFLKRRGTSWVAERPLASQEGLCTKELTYKPVLFCVFIQLFHSSFIPFPWLPMRRIPWVRAKLYICKYRSVSLTRT